MKTKLIVLFLLNSSAIFTFFFFSNCCTDCPEKTNFDFLNEHLSKGWDIYSVIKCDSIDVTNYYTDFSISFSYLNKDDQTGEYVFSYSTDNGDPAFPSKGEIRFDGNNQFNSEYLLGIREDGVEFEIHGLPADYSLLGSVTNLDFDTIGNADCSIPNGKINVRPRYKYRSVSKK